MQTFLTRSSRTSGPTCTLTNAILSTSKGTTSTNDPVIITANHGSNALFRRFGDFYKRFYSTMLGPAVREAEVQSPVAGRSDICRSGMTLESSHGEDSSIHGGAGSMKGEWGSKQTTSDNEGRMKTERSSPVKLFKYSQGCPGAEGSNGKGGYWTGRSQFQIHPNTIETSVQRLVRRLTNHDQLVRSLEREIGRRNLLLAAAHSEDEKLVHTKELKSLQQVYAHITQHFYDASVAGLVMKAIEASQSRAVPEMPPTTSRPYIPPFPHYVSHSPPGALNKSMLNLFHPRIPPLRLLLKISYNLLTSPSAPDVTTYNILIRGFTIHRQNSMAHMVFQSMVDRNLTLDDYSVTTILNLCVKSGDYDSYQRVIRILQTQEKDIDIVPGRSKEVLEAMINGAAKFGHVQRIKMCIRAMKRNFPESPELSLFLLTSLLSIWTEKQNWSAGKKVWHQMRHLDYVAKKQGKALVMDLRAYRQMFHLCKACRKFKDQKLILEQALERGWSAGQVVSPPEKTKGLHVTSEVKVPRLAELTQIYARYTRKKKDSLIDPSRRREVLLRLLERVFDDTELFSSVPLVAKKQTSDDVPEKEFLERVLLPLLEEGPEEAERVRQAVESNHERSRIWRDIISRRLKIVREGMLSPGSFDDERTNDETSGSLGWKPDLIAYTRGVE
ncbi:hypothetical protein BDD12DRAFT_819545 [Trichophaea hybrida]|nr:hypothetical protein BDD12DRAFT_819545 [Trichophaea hybrida]